ncbi:hypothetical protein [Endozoicomonas sp. Mp262]|uniref:hypothetical protein n=1 Tax=Endozoicomonas sp. Mp262 TaxID=2919499 RepID=UPI0021D99FF2
MSKVRPSSNKAEMPNLESLKETKESKASASYGNRRVTRYDDIKRLTGSFFNKASVKKMLAKYFMKGVDQAKSFFQVEKNTVTTKWEKELITQLGLEQKQVDAPEFPVFAQRVKDIKDLKKRQTVLYEKLSSLPESKKSEQQRRKLGFQLQGVESSLKADLQAIDLFVAPFKKQCGQETQEQIDLLVKELQGAESMDAMEEPGSKKRFLQPEKKVVTTEWEKELMTQLGLDQKEVVDTSAFHLFAQNVKDIQNQKRERGVLYEKLSSLLESKKHEQQLKKLNDRLLLLESSLEANVRGIDSSVAFLKEECDPETKEQIDVFLQGLKGSESTEL